MKAYFLHAFFSVPLQGTRLPLKKQDLGEIHTMMQFK